MSRPTASNPSARLAPAKQIARELGVPYTSLRDAHFRGEIEVVKLGRAWYYDRNDVNRWIDSRRERKS
jgi:hypothetical protein